MSNITATMTPDDDIIPEILVVLYNNMDEEEKASWSQETALILIGDMVRYDQSRGFEPLPYEQEDVYTFILALIQQDAEDSS